MIIRFFKHLFRKRTPHESGTCTKARLGYNCHGNPGECE